MGLYNNSQYQYWVIVAAFEYSLSKFCGRGAWVRYIWRLQVMMQHSFNMLNKIFEMVERRPLIGMFI